MKKSLYYYTSLFAWGVVFLLIVFYAFAWNPPVDNPPNANLPAPINTSSIEQTKAGNLNLGGLLRLGLLTSHPTGTNGAIYYNTTDNKFYGYQNNEWKELGSGGGASFWLASGNNIYNTNTGNVGIGTTAPSYKLDVSGGARISKSVHGLSVFNSAQYTTRTYAKIYSQPVPSLSTIGTAYFRININGHNRGQGRAIVELVISGRDFNVQAKVTGILEQKDIIVWHNTETSRYEVYLSTYDWTWPWEIIEITSDVSGGIIEPNPTPITTLPSGSLVYSLSGSTANLVLREGNVGIGTTGPSRKLFVNGDAGGTTGWYNDSDARLKTNVQTIPNALEKVEKMRGVNFEWIDTENHPKGLQVGFIAQELKDVLPEVVDKKGEYYSVQESSITAVLVEAIKEQQKEIENQQKQIEDLKAQIETLKNY